MLIYIQEVPYWMWPIIVILGGLCGYYMSKGLCPQATLKTKHKTKLRKQ